MTNCKERLALLVAPAVYGLSILGCGSGDGSPVGQESAALSTGGGGSQYSVTDLGAFAGHKSYAMGINNSGSVVGYSNVNDSNTHAFLWDGSLHDLEAMCRGCSSAAFGINANGLVAGGPDPGGGDTDAWLWSKAEGFIDLGAWHGIHWGYANGVNNHGVAVGNALQCNNCYDHAFLWDGRLHNLGDLDNNQGESVASSINDDKVVVGQAFTPHAARAFRWTSETGMVDLGTLTGAESAFSDASGINASGVIAGYSDTEDGAGAAVYWSPDPTQPLPVIHRIGKLPGGGLVWSDAINSQGDVVGQSGAFGGVERAFLYCRGGVIRDINTLIPRDSHWQLYEATGINDTGQIVGQGSDDSGKYTHAFLLTPTTPGRPCEPISSQ
jgi:probable HAF family extracellular repeat protein